MLINCPKCNTQYDIDDAFLAAKKTRKMRCANCGEVFSIGLEEAPSPVIDPSFAPESPAVPESVPEPEPVVRAPEPVVEPAKPVITESAPEPVSVPEPEPMPVAEPEPAPAAEPEPIPVADEAPAPVPEPEVQKESEPDGRTEPSFDRSSPAETGQNAEDNMQEIFARLSIENEKIEQANTQISAPRRLAVFIRRHFGLHNSQSRMVFGILLTLILLLYLFYAKYSIVRIFPAAEKAYSLLGIESVVVGEGLDFQNVTRNEFEDDYVRKMEIKGFIVNKTKRKILIPTILAELLDENAATLQSIKGNTNYKEVAPRDRVSFNIVISKPAPLTKYILLTFTREK